jgi:hypothetical protein
VQYNQAYDLSDKGIVKSYGSESYFSAPLSYPYKFSEKGIATIIDNLQSIGDIEKKSISVSSFYNIHKHDQHLFNDKLGRILVEEKYIF